MSAPIRVFSLYSGSEGNAFLIHAPSGNLLIDAGKSARRLCTALSACGVAPTDLDAILVTHEHTDHVSALPVFLKKNPIPVHLANGCVYRLENDPNTAPCLAPHPPLWEGTLGGMRVRSFPTSHDSRASVGYRIDIPYGERVLSLGYATDLGTVTSDVEAMLLGCRAVILESNHDVDMLLGGPYPPDLKRRIHGKRGHLSNTDSAALAARLTSQGTRALLLAHLSRENNLPDLALGECTAAVADASVRIAVAAPDDVTELPLEDLL